MERSTFNFTVGAALCLIVVSIAQYGLIFSGVVPSLALILATVASSGFLGGIGLLAFTGIRLWLSVRGERVAYRVLYHAEEPPDGEAIGRVLQAIARNAGPVTLVWHLRPRTASDAQSTGEGLDIRAMDALPADPEDASLVVGETTSATLNVTLYIVAPSSARVALEGILPSLLPLIWAERCQEPALYKQDLARMPGRIARPLRWTADSACSGDVADPLSCGIHLEELRQSIGVRAGLDTQAKHANMVEVRLTLWPRGLSAVVTSVQSPTAYPHASSEDLSNTMVGGEVGSSPQSQDADLPVLKPLLWGRPPKLSLRLGAWRNAFGGSLLKNLTPVLSVLRRLWLRVRSGTTLHTLALLGPRLAVRYPLWERTGTAMSNPYSRGKKRTTAQAADANSRDPQQDRQDRGALCLRFPSTTAKHTSLDSIEAGEIAPDSMYSLPPLRSQVLVLGSATLDGRPIGLPALSISSRVPDTSLVMEKAAEEGAAVHQPKSGPKLHPMLAENLLIVGGTDPWRRDIAGSLASQAREMGIFVISMDGGPPPDEASLATGKHTHVASTELRRLPLVQYPHTGNSTGSSKSDPLSHARHRSDNFGGRPRTAEIDMDNPAGSVRPNMLFVEAHPSLPDAEGESLALRLALDVGLDCQLRYLRAVRVTGLELGSVHSDLYVTNSPLDHHRTPGESLLEAWLAVLLLRHHRARLRLALRKAGNRPQTGRDGSFDGGQPLSTSSASASLPPHHIPAIPACPDLATLVHILEEPEPLLNLLQRERQAWNDPVWSRVMSEAGGAEGKRALHSVQRVLERVSSIESVELSDLYLYGATLRGQFNQLLRYSAMSRMFSGPPASLANLLDDKSIGLLKVNLSGAYRSEGSSCEARDVARKHYGLYLLWSLLAASQQRAALQTLMAATQATQMNRSLFSGTPKPVLLMMHGAGAWFGSESPFSDLKILDELGKPSSGIAVAATTGGLRHIRAYGPNACTAFGNLVVGPVPIADADAPPLVIELVEAELALMADGMQSLAARLHRQTRPNSTAATTSSGQLAAGNYLVEKLLEVLHRIEEGTALVVTRVPDGQSICTAHLGSAIVDDIRESWLSTY